MEGVQWFQCAAAHLTDQGCSERGSGDQARCAACSASVGGIRNLSLEHQVERYFQKAKKAAAADKQKSACAQPPVREVLFITFTHPPYVLSSSHSPWAQLQWPQSPKQSQNSKLCESQAAKTIRHSELKRGRKLQVLSTDR